MQPVGRDDAQPPASLSDSASSSRSESRSPYARPSKVNLSTYREFVEEQPNPRVRTKLEALCLDKRTLHSRARGTHIPRFCPHTCCNRKQCFDNNAHLRRHLMNPSMHLRCSNACSIQQSVSIQYSSACFWKSIKMLTYLLICAAAGMSPAPLQLVPQQQHRHPPRAIFTAPCATAISCACPLHLVKPSGPLCRPAAWRSPPSLLSQTMVDNLPLHRVVTRPLLYALSRFRGQIVCRRMPTVASLHFSQFLSLRPLMGTGPFPLESSGLANLFSCQCRSVQRR